MSPRPDLVDFHCHLDLYPDLGRAVAACERRRAATLAVTTTPKAFSRNREAAGSSDFVRVALGLHPQLVTERASEIDLFERLLPETRYVGEVGLDAGPRFYRSLELQTTVFRRVLKSCAEAGEKILTLHSVRAAKRVLDLVERELPPGRGTVVLHWFTGTASEARRGVELGCYFSVNDRMLASPAGRRIAAAVPSDRLVTETDGPFVERDGQPVEPADVEPAIASLAKIRDVPPDAMKVAVVENFSRLVSNITTG